MLIGFLLMTAGTALGEASSSLGKIEMRKRVETPFGYAFLTLLAGIVTFLILAAFRLPQQHFALASIPTLSIRIVLEIFQMSVTVYALKTASRSTFGFLRTLTIPGLLVADMLLAYPVSLSQIMGIMLIVSALFLLYVNHGFSKHGTLFALVSAANAILTITLYKYNITQFNSPEIEQLIVLSILLVFAYIVAVCWERRNPLKLLQKPVCLLHAGLAGVGGTLDAMSLLFGAPSVLIAVKRTIGVFASIISGHTVFAEKQLFLKLSAFTLCAMGLILLTQ